MPFVSVFKEDYFKLTYEKKNYVENVLTEAF